MEGTGFSQEEPLEHKDVTHIKGNKGSHRRNQEFWMYSRHLQRGIKMDWLLISGGRVGGMGIGDDWSQLE